MRSNNTVVSDLEIRFARISRLTNYRIDQVTMRHCLLACCIVPSSASEMVHGMAAFGTTKPAHLYPHTPLKMVQADRAG
jgi:hypothetical protein